ncbi:MAG: cofactor-independent phosphoglycerate mutase [Candidatus Omnitrophota bacterium]
MKYAIIVPDGMADQPIPDLGGRTPLEAARTTNMDHMAQNGMQGLVPTIPKGMHPGSEIGNLSLLGYRPESCFTGRAPLEAANSGIQLADDEIAFRCNLVTLDHGEMKDYSAGHIGTEEAEKLIAALNDEIQEEGIRFYPGKSYRHLLILKVRNPREFAEIACTPPHDILDKKYEPHLPKSKPALTLLKIMERAEKILAEHEVNRVRLDLGENPANAIWLWGQGTRPNLPLFKEKYGLDGGIISAVDLINGIGRLIGLNVIDVPGITGYYDTNYRGKADYAIDCLRQNDFVYVHIEAPDEAGHNGDLEAKMSCIEKIDREIVGTFLNHFSGHADFRIMVLPDHPTPISLRTHTADPVPFVIYGKGVASDGSFEYNERSAKTPGILFRSGEELMTYFTNPYL